MFKNIGKKIKVLAKTICIIEIVLYVIASIVMIVCGAILDDYYRWIFIISGIAILIIGPLMSWIGTFFLYGYGELIDKTCIIERKVDSIENQNNQKINSIASKDEETVSFSEITEM